MIIGLTSRRSLLSDHLQWLLATRNENTDGTRRVRKTNVTRKTPRVARWRASYEYFHHYMKTWRHPQNTKPEVRKLSQWLCCQNRTDRSTAEGSMYIKFGNIWMCGFWDICDRTDRQTSDIQTTMIVSTARDFAWRLKEKFERFRSICDDF